jgi:hypothetical protein
VVLAVAAAAAAVPPRAAAQERPEPALRADVIAAQQAEKADRVKPFEQSRAAQRFIELKDGLIQGPHGFHLILDSIYGGGGFTLGAGYRSYYGDRTFWTARGLLSVKLYKLFEVSTDSLGHAGGRVDLHAQAGWRDATQVAYFGLGIDSPQQQASFGFEQTYAGGRVDLRPARLVVLGGGLAFERYLTKEGAGSRPSIETVHTPETAPGLGASPEYVHVTLSAGIDSRPARDYARRGGLYQLTYHAYGNHDGPYSFDQLDAEVVQHIPVLRENWVFSLRGRYQTTLDEDDLIPYFMLPALGSGRTLRAYHSWRFRDRHGLVLSGEWRWFPSRLAMDMALFYDTGQVAPEPGAFRADRFKSDVGVGVRFHTPMATPLRVEVAHGREGFKVVFAAAPAF